MGDRMTNIKERPILFSAPMVRAILEGRKTVTRRAVKFPLIDRDFGCELAGNEIDQSEAHRLCPYGQPGQRLWVRESWWQAGDWQATYPEDDTGAWFGSRRVVYSADGTPPNEPNSSYPSGLRNGAYPAAAPDKIWRHRPSIHMNRWASRILLENTDVRVERLQDISEEQASAEGVSAQAVESFRVAGVARPAGFAFRDLWTSINGDENWTVNPWVWVVEFKRVTP
jgi:hypothetical protein